MSIIMNITGAVRFFHPIYHDKLTVIYIFFFCFYFLLSLLLFVFFCWSRYRKSVYRLRIWSPGHTSRQSPSSAAMTGFYSHQQQLSSQCFFVCSTWSTRRKIERETHNNEERWRERAKSRKTENGLVDASKMKKKKRPRNEPAGPVFATRLPPVTVIKDRVSECAGKRVLYIYHDGPNKAMGLALHYFSNVKKKKKMAKRAGKWKPDYSYFIWFLFLPFSLHWWTDFVIAAPRTN